MCRMNILYRACARAMMYHDIVPHYLHSTLARYPTTWVGTTLPSFSECSINCMNHDIKRMDSSSGEIVPIAHLELFFTLCPSGRKVPPNTGLNDLVGATRTPDGFGLDSYPGHSLEVLNAAARRKSCLVLFLKMSYG